MSLKGKQKRHLRALGHGLNALVQLGKDGVTEALIAAVDQALEDHELVKVRIGQSALIDKTEAAELVAEKTQSQLAQILGNTFLLYRRHPEEPKIQLP